MDAEQRKASRNLLLLLAIITVFMAISHLVSVTMFNHQVHTSVGVATEEDSYMDVHFRGGSTAAWEKLELGLNGIIYDGEFHNNSPYLINSWTMEFHVSGDCYINQFWNGELEIHQYPGTDREVIQTLNLASYDLEEIQLDYITDGSDLLIELHKGDYFIYYPSSRFKEEIIKPGDEVVVGMILYYVDPIDVTDYHVDYYYNKGYTDGIGFWVSCAMAVVFILVLSMRLTAIVVYRKANHAMELRTSGISCMSEIYTVIYMIDLLQDTLTPIAVDEASDKQRPKELPASQQLSNLFQVDPEPAYRDLMVQFSDLSTLPKRLAQRNSLTTEYESQNYGWSRIRFIVMDRSVDGNLERVLFTVEQINEEKKELDEVRNRVEEAESESKAKSAFLANMSHEIRTPINAILGMDTMILRESKDKLVRNYAKDIKNAGTMLLSLINTILDFSKLEAGRMELVPGEYSVQELIYDVQSLTRNRVESKKLKLEIDVTEDMPCRLYGDDVRLKQVIINLLTNAAKYTEEGTVRLGVYGKAIDDKRVHLLISVKDTGLGIKEEDQKKLTERFARFDTKKNRTVEGTGIGMNLVSSLLEMMGSKLEVVSIYGRGSDFFFELEQGIVDASPLGKHNWEEREDDEEEVYGASFIAPDAHILVVDDNDMNRMVFRNLLKETEIQIEEASGGKKALALTKKNTYDLIFMDHMMPEMNGVEAMEAIKIQADGKNQKTPIIVLTANALQGAKEEYQRLGFVDFLAKPVKPEALESTIMKYLPEDLYEKRAKKADDSETKEVTMPDIEGVDAMYALEHVGSLDGVIAVGKQFIALAESDAEELHGYWERLKEHPEDNEALNSYRIKVHAMKTSANLCGALQVSGVAAQLESEAIHSRVDAIVDITPHFLRFWLHLKEVLLTQVPKNQEPKKEAMDVERLHTLLHQLTTAMNSYDIKTADALVDEISSHDMDDYLAEKVTALKTAVAQLDAPGCEALCKEIMND